MKLKLAGLLLASVAVGVVSRLLVNLADTMRRADQRSPRAEVDAAVREAVRQGGYRAHVRCDLPN